MAPRARIALLGAAGGAAALVAVWIAAFHVARLVGIDQRVLEGFVDLQAHPRVSGLAARIASICNPKPYGVLALMIVAWALARGRARLALWAGAMLVAAPLTTEFLKPRVAASRPSAWLLAGQHPIPPGSWPSGHATAAMSLALAVTLVAPARWRPWVAAAGAAFAAAVCFSFLTLQWHYPSDVIGGFLIAFTWSALAVAGATQTERGPVERQDALEDRLRAMIAPLALLGGAVLSGAVLLALRRHPVGEYAASHLALTAGAVVIGSLALALPTALSLVARR